MTWPVFLVTAVAGGLGASLRLAVDGAAKERLGAFLPWGTLVINISGSFLLGLLVGLGQRWELPSDWTTGLGTGLLGGYTTFSTASVETVRLVQAQRFAAAAVSGLGMLVVAVLAAALGVWLGSM